jgi:hypothetical protein
MDNEDTDGLLSRAQRYRDIASSLRDDRVLANIIRIAAAELEERAKDIELQPKADVTFG